MERPFLSVSLPGGNPQHTVTYKWSLWINLLTDSYSMAAPKKQIISSSWGLSICMELVQHGTARRSNITLLLDSHFLLVSFDLSAFYLGWGCRGRCLLHKTGSGWGCAGQFLEGRWRWGTEKTSDGTNSPPSSWQPARRLRGEGRIGKKGGKQRKKTLFRTKHFKIFFACICFLILKTVQVIHPVFVAHLCLNMILLVVSSCVNDSELLDSILTPSLCVYLSVCLDSRPFSPL